MIIIKITKQNDLIFDVDNGQGEYAVVKVTLENHDKHDLSLRLTAALQHAIAADS